MSEQREKPMGVGAKLHPEKIRKLMDLYSGRGLQEDGEYFSVEIPDPKNPRTTKMHKFEKIDGRGIEDHIKELIADREKFTK